MTAPLKARPAQPMDVANLVRLLNEAYTDQGGVYPEADQHMLLSWVTEVLNTGYTVVIEKSGRIVGSLALVAFQYPWSREWLLNMEWFYVQRRFRRNAAADALLLAAHGFADERGASIVGGISSAKDTTLKDRLMSMRGYTYTGGQFFRKAKNGKQTKDEDQE